MGCEIVEEGPTFCYVLGLFFPFDDLGLFGVLGVFD
jgi:hypothetical protein